MTLEEALKFIETKKDGKRSASAKYLIDSEGADATRNSFKQENRLMFKPDDQCGYCRKKGHGKSTPLCPTYSHTCSHCGVLNHCENMCRNKDC